MQEPFGWITHYAAQRGLRYEPAADERWLRAWEPYTTLKTPVRYEHALYATGTAGSLTIARMTVDLGPAADGYAREAAAWICIAQDVRVDGRAAVTNDFGRVFSESPDLVPMPRCATGDGAFDRVFASFSPSEEELRQAITPGVRRLLLSWATPVHVDVRKGGFVLGPVALGGGPASLDWLARAAHYFGEKATKRV